MINTVILNNSKPDPLFIREGTDFSRDVLSILHRRNVKFRGCKPEYIEMRLDGGVEVHFHGWREIRGSVQGWRGKVQFNCPWPPDKIYLANPAVVAEICETGIKYMDAD